MIAGNKDWSWLYWCSLCSRGCLCFI